MNLLEQIREKAKKAGKTIVLPEGTEERTIRAVPLLAEGKIANPILLGDPAKIKGLADGFGVDVSGAELINPIDAPYFDDFVQQFYEMRKNKKGMTLTRRRRR